MRYIWHIYDQKLPLDTAYFHQISNYFLGTLRQEHVSAVIWLQDLSSWFWWKDLTSPQEPTREICKPDHCTNPCSCLYLIHTIMCPKGTKYVEMHENEAPVPRAPVLLCAVRFIDCPPADILFKITFVYMLDSPSLHHVRAL